MAEAHPVSYDVYVFVEFISLYEALFNHITDTSRKD